ncbi:MAG: LytTR family DNA-binding domain-containing protein [Saprospiraceae bacterium]|nr:response regulator transcription factor [Lewinella sp.]
MIRVVIVDDEAATRSLLRRFFQDFFPEVELLGEADCVSQGVELLKKTSPDLLFLDIQMPDGSGFDLLHHFKQPDFKLIFITAYDQFALKAFQYNAIDYLLKPLEPQSLRDAINKVLERSDIPLQPRINGLREVMENRQANRIALSSAEGYAFYELSEIVRLESSGNYTTFYIQDGQRTTVAKTIKEYETLLPAENFYRVHQSHIVSLKHVRKVLKEDNGVAVMVDGSKVPISRRKKDTFLTLLTRQSI